MAVVILARWPSETQRPGDGTQAMKVPSTEGRAMDPQIRVPKARFVPPSLDQVPQVGAQGPRRTRIVSLLLTSKPPHLPTLPIIYQVLGVDMSC